MPSCTRTRQALTVAPVTCAIPSYEVSQDDGIALRLGKHGQERFHCLSTLVFAVQVAIAVGCRGLVLGPARPGPAQHPVAQDQKPPDPRAQADTSRAIGRICGQFGSRMESVHAHT